MQDTGPRFELLHVAEFCLSECHALPGEHTHVLSSQFCFSPIHMSDPGAACDSTAARSKFYSWGWWHTIRLSLWLYNLVLHLAVEQPPYTMLKLWDFLSRSKYIVCKTYYQAS